MPCTGYQRRQSRFYEHLRRCRGEERKINSRLGTEHLGKDGTEPTADEIAGARGDSFSWEDIANYPHVEVSAVRGDQLLTGTLNSG